MAGASGKKLDECLQARVAAGPEDDVLPAHARGATSAEKSTGKGGELNAVPDRRRHAATGSAAGASGRGRRKRSSAPSTTPSARPASRRKLSLPRGGGPGSQAQGGRRVSPGFFLGIFPACSAIFCPRFRVVPALPPVEEAPVHTPASIAGHPIHPMLVPIAIGCFVILVRVGPDLPRHGRGRAVERGRVLHDGRRHHRRARRRGPGLSTCCRCRRSPSKPAVTHMCINLLVVAIYICNAWIRAGGPAALHLPMTCWPSLSSCCSSPDGWAARWCSKAGVGVHGPGESHERADAIPCREVTSCSGWPCWGGLHRHAGRPPAILGRGRALIRSCPRPTRS